MIGYPVLILLIGKMNKKEINKNYSYKPTVTVLIVAHNEEKVIKDKLENCLKLNYPKQKLEILVASDNSTDGTNEIVRELGKRHKNIRLHNTEEHKGKTNAQNEAIKSVDSEVIVMTDANPLLDKDSVMELVSMLHDRNISYVCGKSQYVNSKEGGLTAMSENLYWRIDSAVKEEESRLQTITAGDGALYACRRCEYFNFPPIFCHDSAMPLYFALKGKRAVCNFKAIAYEKAGEKDSDEFMRKVRMNRRLLQNIIPCVKILNVFRYKWFTFFYIGHRTCRYLLWFFHMLFFISNIFLALDNKMYLSFLIIQIFFMLTSFLEATGKFKFNNKIVHMISYYGMTVLAQYIGIYKILTGKAKPTWEIAKTTR